MLKRMGAAVTALVILAASVSPFYTPTQTPVEPTTNSNSSINIIELIEPWSVSNALAQRLAEQLPFDTNVAGPTIANAPEHKDRTDPETAATETETVIETQATVHTNTTPTNVDNEVYVMAQMLAGECYDYNLEDQRNAAIVVCNRVDAGGYYAPYDTVEKVIKYTGFYGWSSSNVPSANNLQVAAEVIADWHARQAGQSIDRPWHNYMSFSGCNGTDHNNYY